MAVKVNTRVILSPGYRNHACGNQALSAWFHTLKINADPKRRIECSRHHGSFYADGRPVTALGALRPFFADPIQSVG